jgi:hypothetical protein
VKGERRPTAMDHNITVLERAFQLAKSGRCTSIGDIRQQLSSEGYSTEHITGRGLIRQLKALMRPAQTPNRPPRLNQSPSGSALV